MSGLWGKIKRLLQRDSAPPPDKPNIVIPQVTNQSSRQGTTAVAESPTSPVDPIFLRQQMSNQLDDMQLSTIGREIGLDYASLPGGKGRKVLALVTAYEKQGKLAALLALCQNQNGNIEWQMEKNDE